LIVPIYEYVCKSCNQKFEKLVRSMNSDEVIPCPECGGKKTSRQFSSFAVGAGAGKSSGHVHGGGCGCCAAADSCPNRME
jgi:putative FmdB family regulatory protein